MTAQNETPATKGKKQFDKSGYFKIAEAFFSFKNGVLCAMERPVSENDLAGMNQLISKVVSMSGSEDNLLGYFSTAKSTNVPVTDNTGSTTERMPEGEAEAIVSNLEACGFNLEGWQHAARTTNGCRYSIDIELAGSSKQRPSPEAAINKMALTGLHSDGYAIGYDSCKFGKVVSIRVSKALAK